MVMTGIRPRLLVLVMITACVLGAVVLTQLASDDTHDGSALYPHGVIGGSGPLAPGEPLTFGQVRTWNQSGKPVKLLSAKLLRVDPDLKLLGFTAIADPSAPATAREHPVPGAVPLADFPPQPPARETQFVVLYALEVRPGKKGGVAAGVELRYQQGDAVRTQTFPAIAYVCTGDPKTSDCAQQVELGSYEEEVKKRPRSAS